MSTILVFGATGAIGGFLLAPLATRHHVIAASRAPHAAQSAGIKWIQADLNAAYSHWPQVDTIISLGPLDAFAWWLERYPASTLRRVIALSSMSAQSKCDSADPHERELAGRLCGSEARVFAQAQASGFACTIFRPTLIYGVGTDRSLAPIACFAQRWHVLPLPLGASGLRQPVHAADLADACIAVLDTPATFGKTYALGGGERLRFDAMLWRLRTATGFLLPLPIPAFVLRALVACRPGGTINAAMLARLRQPLLADNTPATQDFGFAPREFVARDAAGPKLCRPAK